MTKASRSKSARVKASAKTHRSGAKAKSASRIASKRSKSSTRLTVSKSSSTTKPAAPNAASAGPTEQNEKFSGLQPFGLMRPGRTLFPVMKPLPKDERKQAVVITGGAQGFTFLFDTAESLWQYLNGQGTTLDSREGHYKSLVLLRVLPKLDAKPEPEACHCKGEFDED